jgi:peroxiredoxin Q/BCP
VSKDTVASHKRFEEKYGLPFTLLSDPELQVIEAYDVLVESVTKTGKTTRKLVRSTYLIDEEGVIARAFGKVKAKDNARQMLDELA